MLTYFHLRNNPRLKRSLTKVLYCYQQKRHMQNTAHVSKDDLLKQLAEVEAVIKAPNSIQAFIAKEEKMFCSSENRKANVAYHENFLKSFNKKLSDKTFLNEVGTFKYRITAPNYKDYFDTLP